MKFSLKIIPTNKNHVYLLQTIAQFLLRDNDP